MLPCNIVYFFIIQIHSTMFQHGTNLVEGHNVFPLTTSTIDHLVVVLIVLIHVIIMFLYCLVVLLFIMLCFPLSLLGVSISCRYCIPPIMDKLNNIGYPCLMSMGWLMLLTYMLFKDALKCHTHGEFKQHKNDFLE